MMQVQPNAPPGDTLHSTRELAEGQKLVSADQKHHLIMQRDGNFVCYYRDKSIWSSKTAHKACGPYTLAMQEDRNLVVYATPRNPIWHTGTNIRGVGPARPVMRDDENIVIDDATNKHI